MNAVRHLSAVAAEAQLDLDVVAIFDAVSVTTPLLCSVRPNGAHRIMKVSGASNGTRRFRGAARVFTESLAIAALGTGSWTAALSGLNCGITVGQVMPEAAEGGPLAVVRDGDPILIDVDDGTLDLCIPEAELEERLAAHAPDDGEPPAGLLGLYRELVQPISRGAVLGPRDGRKAAG